MWLRARARFGEPRDVVAAPPGGPEEVILRGPPLRGDGSEQLGFLAGGEGVVAVTLTDFARTESSLSVGESGVWSGPPRPELQPVPVLRAGELAADVAVAGGRLLVLAARDDPRRRGRLVERDLATGAQRARQLSPHAGALAAAGRFVAILAQRGHEDLTRITVRDARTWRMRTRVTVPSDLVEVGARLRPDATLAVVYGSERLKLAVARAGARRLRRVRAAKPTSYALAFHRGAPVVVQRTRRGERLVRAAPGRRPRALTPPYREIHSFAAGGRMLAWVTGRHVMAARR